MNIYQNIAQGKYKRTYPWYSEETIDLFKKDLVEYLEISGNPKTDLMLGTAFSLARYTSHDGWDLMNVADIALALAQLIK